MGKSLNRYLGIQYTTAQRGRQDRSLGELTAKAFFEMTTHFEDELMDLPAVEMRLPVLGVPLSDSSLIIFLGNLGNLGN